MGRKPKRGVVSPNGGWGTSLLFSLTLFLSAFLLFTVQPMFAKMVLPLLGGAPAVWNACLVFYQAALLAGYLYAHLSLKWLGPRRQAVLHLALMGLAWIVLPIRVAEGWLPPATSFPAPWLWMLLTVSLGLPFMTVSASAPMLQAWFANIAQDRGGRDPYFLYAASNLGSLLALLTYPLVIEATAALPQQSRNWAIGYGLLIALIAGCVHLLYKLPVLLPKANRNKHGPARNSALNGNDRLLPHDVSPRPGTEGLPAEIDERPTFRRRLRWLAWSLVPSSLLLGVTMYISSEIMPAPFLWVIPLGLYLLTFVLVFAPRTIVPLNWMVRWQPILMVVTTTTLLYAGTALREVLIFGILHLATFFVTAMVCHGQLAADRPPPSRLTEFYLWMSLGGVLGGLFSALVAPLIFRSVVEYPLMLAAACLLRPPKAAGTRRVPSVGSTPLPSQLPAAVSGAPACGSRTAHGARRIPWRNEAFPVTALLVSLVMAWGLRAGGLFSGWRFANGPAIRFLVVFVAAAAAFLLRRRPPVFATAVAVVAAVSLWSVETGVRLLETDRSFFGILRVEYDPIANVHQLLNGTTMHGRQSLFASQRHEPLGYFHRNGPLGQVFRALKPRRPMSEVGVLGLGAGTIAAYAEPGERFTFYEIDPAVERIAQNPHYFTYLSDCRGKAEVILGDARLSLVNGPEREFDLLVVDVFSSDFVPVHLINKEALAIYLRRMSPGGLLAIHISSRYFNLAPILGRLAEEAHLVGRIKTDARKSAAEELTVGKTSSEWVVMARNADDLGPLADDETWRPIALDPGPAWTDAFSNVAGALRWKTPDQRLFLLPARWVTLNPAEEHAALAMALLKENRIDEAMEHWQTSLELNPDNAFVQFSLGTALLSRGRLDEAVLHLQEAVRIAPDYAIAHHDLGVALQQKGKTDEAIEHYLRAFQLEPGYVEAFHDLGKSLLGSQKYEQAERCFRKAIAIQSDAAEIHFDLGRALRKQGKIKDALSELHRALPLAESQKDSPLVKQIETEIRQCEAWPWDQ
jgi:tetratricopeptide (TPR) repeat protein